MAVAVAAYHFRQGDVYHILDDCPGAEFVDRESRRPGTAGRRLCKNCVWELLPEAFRER